MSPITVGGREVRAYTLERIAGEKLRAFLSSLPAYRAKVSRPGNRIRAKDLYDLALVRRARPLTDRPFWHLAGQEFRLACRSRFVDCAGLPTFHEAWERTRAAYASLPTPGDVPFEEAEAALAEAVAFLEKEGVLPLSFPLPPPGTGTE